MPWLMKHGASRALAAGLTCAGLVVLVCGALVAVIHSLSESAGKIADGLADAGDELADRFGPAGRQLQSAVDGMSDAGATVARSVASGVVSGLSLATEVLAIFVLALALVYLFLRDGHRSEAFARHLVPGAQADTAVACGRRAYHSLAGFMQGTTLIALIDSLLIFTGLVILDVPGAAGLGALVFMGAYIPFVGAFLSGLVAVLVAFAHGGTSTALWALGVVLVVQAIEGNFLQPFIQSRTVSLHPATIMMSVAAGASIAGVLGALLAVPLAAAGVGIVEELRTRAATTPENESTHRPPGA
ncbi:AI-2E family transporter [Streptomyces sp. NBC_01408]|uniref:AI-2E family transporter n=1 Tax=Streptomyces sp. NBC_01408 TaxID=2903855 RepID=UPI0022524995|nr:AI-2E family transporter [Streptomyces sp. NBC_01408]MCX4696945.1 AI-2E family transporter [Streptomyces sp. NBC_01408]